MEKALRNKQKHQKETVGRRGRLRKVYSNNTQIQRGV